MWRATLEFIFLPPFIMFAFFYIVLKHLREAFLEFQGDSFPHDSHAVDRGYQVWGLGSGFQNVPTNIISPVKLLFDSSFGNGHQRSRGFMPSLPVGRPGCSYSALPESSHFQGCFRARITKHQCNFFKDMGIFDTPRFCQCVERVQSTDFRVFMRY